MYCGQDGSLMNYQELCLLTDSKRVHRRYKGIVIMVERIVRKGFFSPVQWTCFLLALWSLQSLLILATPSPICMGRGANLTRLPSPLTQAVLLMKAWVWGEGWWWYSVIMGQREGPKRWGQGYPCTYLIFQWCVIGVLDGSVKEHDPLLNQSKNAVSQSCYYLSLLPCHCLC